MAIIRPEADILAHSRRTSFIATKFPEKTTNTSPLFRNIEVSKASKQEGLTRIESGKYVEALQSKLPLQDLSKALREMALKITFTYNDYHPVAQKYYTGRGITRFDEAKRERNPNQSIDTYIEKEMDSYLFLKFSELLAPATSSPSDVELFRQFIKDFVKCCLERNKLGERGLRFVPMPASVKTLLSLFRTNINQIAHAPTVIVQGPELSVDEPSTHSEVFARAQVCRAVQGREIFTSDSREHQVDVIERLFQRYPSMQRLDLSHNTILTYEGLRYLIGKWGKKLTHLNLTNCPNIDPLYPFFLLVYEPCFKNRNRSSGCRFNKSCYAMAAYPYCSVARRDPSGEIR